MTLGDTEELRRKFLGEKYEYGIHPDDRHIFKLLYTTVPDEKGNYLEAIGTSINMTEQREREKNYEGQLHLKELMASKAVAVAYFNLRKMKPGRWTAKPNAVKRS